MNSASLLNRRNTGPFTISEIFYEPELFLGSLLNSVISLVRKTQAGIYLPKRDRILQHLFKHTIHPCTALLLPPHRAEGIGESPFSCVVPNAFRLPSMKVFFAAAAFSNRCIPRRSL